MHHRRVTVFFITQTPFQGLYAKFLHGSQGINSMENMYFQAGFLGWSEPDAK